MSLKISNFIIPIQVLATLATPLFFSIMAILNIDYEGADSSPVFIIYMGTIAILSLISYIFSCIQSGFLKQELFLILILGFIVSTHFLWVIFDPIKTKLFTNSFIFFVIIGLPGFFAAASAIKLRKLGFFIKLIEVAVLIIALGLISYSVLPTIAGISTRSLAGATYQTLSYYSAFCFGVLLTYINVIPFKYRFGVAALKPYLIFTYVILFLCLVGTLLGGGRGALILLIIYLTVYMSTFIRIKNWISSSSKAINNLLKLTSILILFVIFIISFWEKEFIQSGLNRATQFISSDGTIDLESGSSGRDVVYTEALSFINKHPYRGYGPFGALDNTIQAHNIFLDIVLQFGYFGLFMCLIGILCLIITAFRNWSVISSWAFSLMLYPIIMLMFSGYYMHTAIFIFGISFFSIYRLDKNRNLINIRNIKP